MKTNALYAEIACSLNTLRNCEASATVHPWTAKHRERIEELTEALPSGSGIDNGVHFDFDASTPEKLVFTFGYHHMSESGMYDGWTEHTLIVRPSLAFGISLRITGRDRNRVKEYLYDTFQYALTQPAPAQRPATADA